MRFARGLHVRPNTRTLNNPEFTTLALFPCVFLRIYLMNKATRVALKLFVNRLASRSVLTDEEVTALLGLKGQVKQIAGRVDVVGLGEQVDHSCLVVDGLLGRFGQSRVGARQITCLHIPGDMADLPSVVSPRAGWGIKSLTSTTLLLVPHADLRRVATMHLGITEAFWRDCVADGSISSEWVVNVGRRDALARLAHLFCEMAIRCEHAGQGDRQTFPLPITQTDLADVTGMTDVHVNRTLRQLRTRSIAELRGGTVTIHDWEQLACVGDFDAGFLLLDGPSPRMIDAD
jgi:CRP-like cAMP-binding protein